MCISKSASSAGLFVPFGFDQRIEKKKKKSAFETRMEQRNFFEEGGIFIRHIFHGIERNLGGGKVEIRWANRGIFNECISSGFEPS